MLWYKGWLETRGKMLFALLITFFPVVMLRNKAALNAGIGEWAGQIATLSFFWTIVPLFLAGSGIKTQTLLAKRGLHASMYYTLSLPVSRLRLFATRATLGFIEAAAILALVPFAMPFLFPALRNSVTEMTLFEYWLTFIVCSTVFYSIGLVLSTFLDDLTQNWTSLVIIILMWSGAKSLHLPASLDVFSAVGKNSPLFTHSLPWAPMGVAIAAAAILCTTASRIVSAREY